MSELLTEMYGPNMQKTSFQALIQLDRYTVKELDTSKIKAGDVIVAVVDDSDPDHVQKDFGRVTVIQGDTLAFIGEVTGQDYIVPLRRVFYPLDWRWEESVDRMVEGVTAADKKYFDESEGPDLAYAERLRDALFNERIVPGGRVQASLGAKEKYGKELNLTAYNCYVIPSPTDSRVGIMETLTTMTEVMSRGGGVGINLSTLRPRYAKVYGVNGTSSGSVSWGGVYSYVTGLIEQGGSRRGALMLQLHISHPDVLDFIDAKRVTGHIENANLSVQITREFMEAVENGDNWQLIFPDTKNEFYELWGTSVCNDIHEWLEMGLPVVVYNTIKARDLFEKICKSAWTSAEPGFVIYDRMNDGHLMPTQQLVRYTGYERRELYVLDPPIVYVAESPWNNTYYYQKNVATNPCGEQPLPPWGICNLIHINLAEFYDPKTNDVQWDELATTVADAVRFADNIIDYTPYHFLENKNVQKDQRRVGLGTMGLADLLIDLKFRYGSDESLVFIDRLYGFIKNQAYKASALLAAERGMFPKYSEKILEARIPKSLDPYVRELIRRYGLRNSHLLTQAPTGTTATKTGRRGYSVGTGIEPFFALEWTRTSRMSTATDYLGKAKEWLAAHPGQNLPDYFVSAMATKKDGTPQITPHDHINVQAVIQRHNDSAISKTTNVPNGFTVEDTVSLYKFGYEAGIIGLTIYRDGSRDEQVLTVKDSRSEDDPQETTPGTAWKVVEVDSEPQFYKRPVRLYGETVKTPTPFGKAYVTVNYNHKDEIEELFIKLGKTGADIAAISDGLAIALTGMLSPRISHLSQDRKVDWLVRKFRGISGANTVGLGPNKVESLPDAIAKVLEMVTPAEDWDDEDPKEQVPEGELFTVQKGEVVSLDICPSCGQATFVRQDGCYTCQPDIGGCGYSKCG